MKHIWEVDVDGSPYDVEPDEKGVMFRKRGSHLPFIQICWQDVYSAAWEFTRIRLEYEKKTAVGQ